MSLSSAIYEGRVVHQRHRPHPHAFSYRMGQLCLDLDEIDQVFQDRWLWSVNRRNLAQWRRDDYLAGAPSLIDEVRDRVQTRLGYRPEGPVRLLTHPRYLGYVFNPVSFYYCYEADDDTLAAVVADITNTPWKQRHCVVLPAAEAQRVGDAFTWQFDKRFHISPFMPMDCRYDWRLSPPGEQLRVHMRVDHAGQRQFDADLQLSRRPLNAAGLARLLWRYPWMTAQVMGAIHWQALRLWLKRNPIHDHPGTQHGEKL